MSYRLSQLVLCAGLATLVAAPALGQSSSAPPADGQLPQVDVIQEKPKPAPAQAAPKPKPKPVAKKAPAPAPEPVSPEPVVAQPDNVGTNPNPSYGAENSDGAAARAGKSAQSPINAKQITPTDLQGFASPATNVTGEALEEQQARTTNEVFTRVPGVTVVNDDGLSHHGGIGMRGSPARRSRKVLVMEDGQPLALALWLDPSLHYIPPLERIESIEVIRGGSIVHGPNNNHGVINLRNLSPFGPNETEIGAAIGWVENGGRDLYGLSNKRHVHTRQSLGNFGMVLSYSGAEADGTWDTERLRHNDFYAALGWKGVDQDLTVQFTHARQRDDYDESNLEGEDDDEPGEVEEAFFDIGHCKTCFAPGSVFNNYNGDITRGQITHNLYVDLNTTITSKIYAQHHRRDRYQIVTLEDNPADAEDPGVTPEFDGDEVFLAEGSMFGRLRTFRNVGAEVRAEFANQPLAGGMTHDIQTGLRYEHQSFTNRNFLGQSGEVLEDGDKEGLTIFQRNLEADAVSAFVQTSVHVNNDFKVVPGVRFEWYRVKRDNFVTAQEEGEAEEGDPVDCNAVLGIGECLEIEGIERGQSSESFDKAHVLPGISFAYEGFYRSTIYGGYTRGVATNVLRNEEFEPDSEIGDNFQLGMRSTAIRGLTFDIAAFHHRIEGFQIQQAFASTAGDKAFGRADLVHIDGVELYGRLDSKPFTGGPWNLYGEANYTYARAIIKDGETSGENPGEEIDISGKEVPETPFHVAALTLGLQHRPSNGWNWDVSATYTYRGELFTDELNTPFGTDPEGENGQVPDVWLLSARANLKIGTTGASVFVAGDNLTNELYITDREDGLKPGQGRTFWTGFNYKF